MRVAVVGVGAMGGLWAARLSTVAEEVWAVDASPEIVAAIAAGGIRLQADAEAGGDLTARVRATTRLAEVPEPDVAFVFVKAQHTASVARDLAHVGVEGTTVVTLQNGLGNADVLRGAVSVDRLVVGVTYESATVLEAGAVRRNAAGSTWLGPIDPSTGLERADRVAALMTEAGFVTTASPMVLTEVWRKLVLNASALGVSALTTLRPAEMAHEPEIATLVDELAAETVAVARATGNDIDLDERLDVIHQILAKAGMGKGSMLQDVEARRKTEVEVINGAVVRVGREAGIGTPLNIAVLALVHGLERSWRR